MRCKPEYDMHTEECIKGIEPCYGPECCICGAKLSTDLHGNKNPTCCHECADGITGRIYREYEVA